MKIIWFTYENIGLSIVKKLIDEGNDVLVAQVQDILELMDDKSSVQEEKKRSKMDKDEKNIEKEKAERRLTMYDGMFKKLPATDVIKMMKDIQNKDEYFIMFDFNNLWKYAEKALEMGYKNGLFPNKWDYDMEKDREAAKEFVEKHYDRLEVAEVQEFKTVEDAISFLDETEDLWVLKGNSDDEAAKTYVPRSDDVEKEREALVGLLNSAKEAYEKEGFILERKIRDIKEITPEILFYNGEVVFTNINIENKAIGSGNVSKQTGCMQNLIAKTNIDDEINKISFPEEVYNIAKQRKGIFVWDASILYSPKENKYYFGEFCSQRFGWDSVFSEIAMSGGATRFFEKIMEGENPFIYNFGVAVRGLNINRDKEFNGAEKGLEIICDDEENTWIYEVKKDGEKLVNTGDCWDLVVFTGASDCVEDAVDQAYKAADCFTFEELYIRPKFDFLSWDYQTSIPNRFKIFNNSLFKLPDIMEDQKDVMNRELAKRDCQIEELANKIETIINQDNEEE